MGILSDSRGNTNFLDLGNVSLLEASLSTAFFVAVASVFSNFDVTIPTGDTSTIGMANQLASVNVPVLGTAVFELGVTIALILFLHQVIDASIKYGRGGDPQLRDWVNSIPTGLTIGVIGVALIHVAYLFQYAPILDIVTGGLVVEFVTVAVSTAVYWAISSQG